MREFIMVRKLCDNICYKKYGGEMMKELSLDEIKFISFELLCKIDSICRKNGFTYSLAYGTLLGAVRHNGFIPCDDDVDIMMPRADYNNFVE